MLTALHLGHVTISHFMKQTKDGSTWLECADIFGDTEKSFFSRSPPLRKRQIVSEFDKAGAWFSLMENFSKSRGAILRYSYLYNSDEGMAALSYRVESCESSRPDLQVGEVSCAACEVENARKWKERRENLG